MIDQIHIKGFKSIKDVELSLRPLNILVGANGVGKSNFIGLFRLLNSLVAKNLQTYVAQSGGADRILHFGKRNTQMLEISFRVGRYAYYVQLSADTADSLFLAQEVIRSYNNRGRLEQEIPLGIAQRETSLHEIRTPRNIISALTKELEQWQIYHFHDTGDSAKVKLTNDINDNRYLRTDAANLAAYLYYLREREITTYQTIVGSVRLVAPFFDDFVLQPLRLNPQKIQLEWREQGSDAYFNASSLSDGTLRFISLATLLLQPTLPSTLLIDEPELGLHPFAIGVLADMLRSASVRSQVIVATQSSTLVNQFAPEDILVVERKDRSSEFRHLDVESLEIWLEEYGLGELWEKNVIGGRPKP